jgi:hypothetical protein
VKKEGEISEMPKSSERSELLDNIFEFIQYKSVSVKYALDRGLLTDEQELQERSQFRRLLDMYEIVSNERYVSSRIHKMVDHSTLNFLLVNLSDRGFKQQFRMERDSFTFVLSKITQDLEVTKL